MSDESATEAPNPASADLDGLTPLAFVEARQAAARFLLTMHSVGDIRQYATGMRLEIQDVDETVLRGSKAALIGARPGRRFLRITGIRRRDRDNKPVSHAEMRSARSFPAAGFGMAWAE